MPAWSSSRAGSHGLPLAHWLPWSSSRSLALMVFLSLLGSHGLPLSHLRRWTARSADRSWIEERSWTTSWINVSCGNVPFGNHHGSIQVFVDCMFTTNSSRGTITCCASSVGSCYTWRSFIAWHYSIYTYIRVTRWSNKSYSKGIYACYISC